MQSVEAKLNEVIEENKQLKEALAFARIDGAWWERESRMNNAGLTHDAKTRLHRAFENSKDNAGLKEAINTEKKRGR
ncbi:MAG TPA: hypothetical protein VF123_11515 [Candidatus Sulfotelmatobacter sp.]